MYTYIIEILFWLQMYWSFIFGNVAVFSNK